MILVIEINLDQFRRYKNSSYTLQWQGGIELKSYDSESGSLSLRDPSVLHHIKAAYCFDLFNGVKNLYFILKCLHYQGRSIKAKLS